LALALDKHVMSGGIDAVQQASNRFHQRLEFKRVARFRELGHKFGPTFMQRFVKRAGSCSS
jgi:L-amino acid N-acyltransferase YncA